jgi:hypothetical protein
MARLIDADDFKKFLQALCNAGAPYDDIIKLLDKQPTAYDVEKVVAELETVFPINPYPNEFTNGRNLGIRKAIDIVRKGGVE